MHNSSLQFVQIIIHNKVSSAETYISHGARVKVQRKSSLRQTHTHTHNVQFPIADWNLCRDCRFIKLFEIDELIITARDGSIAARRRLRVIRTMFSIWIRISIFMTWA